jgi:hypothetical protein
VTADRAVILACIADGFMDNRGMMPLPETDGWPEGCTGMWAEHVPMRNEVWFTVRYPDQDIVTSRSLAGYSLEGGLHRETSGAVTR